MAKQDHFHKKIPLKATDVAALYGKNKANLRQIRSMLPRVKIIGSDQSVSVSAAKFNDVSFSANAIEALLGKVAAGVPMTPQTIKETIATSLKNDNKKLRGINMSKPDQKISSTIHTKQGKEVDAFMDLTQNGWLHKRLKEDFNITLRSYRTKIHLESAEDTKEAASKRTKAEEIVRETLEVQKAGKHMTDKYYNALVRGEKPQPEMKTVIKDNGKTVQQPIKQHPRQVEVELINSAAAQQLFQSNSHHLEMLRGIFQADINLKGNATATIKPNGSKITRKPTEMQQEQLLVTQASNVLTALATAAAAHEMVSDKAFAIIVMTAVKGATNEEKTRRKLYTQLGRVGFPELEGATEIIEQTQASEPEKIVLPKKNDKNHKSMTTFGDFGDKFVNDLTIEGLFARKLGFEMDYIGRDLKSLTLIKKKDCKVSFEQAFNVVNYAQTQYAEAQNTLQPALVENAIDNVLAGRPVDFISQDRKEELEAGKKREQYRMSTFNKKGSANALAYPNLPSQYEMHDVMLGKPSRDPQRAYNQEASAITFLIGPAGSGKTFMGVAVGVHAFYHGWAKNVYFLRPQVGTNGKPPALVPGDMKMKSASALAPIYENLEIVMPNDVAAKYVREPLPPGTPMPPNVDMTRKIEIGDASMYRGRTITGYAYIDEAQNLKRDELKMMMTRVGKGSHMHFSFDLDQIDLPNKAESGAPGMVIALYEAMKRDARPKHIKGVICNGNNRHDAVDEALDLWHAFETNNKELTREKRAYTWETEYKKALKIYYGTDDVEEAHKIRERERKYGFDKTGYAPMRNNMRQPDDQNEGRIIEFNTAKQEMDISKLVQTGVTAAIKQLVDSGVLAVAKPA